MADQNNLNKPDLTSRYDNEVFETFRGHIVRLWKGDYTGMGNLVTGIRRWVRVGTTDVKLVERNAVGTEDTLFDSSGLALKDGTNALGEWDIDITGNAASASNAVTVTNSHAFKNRIINGQMQIAQRATSATIIAGGTIAAGYATVDRFYTYCTGGNVTAAQVAGSGATKNRLQLTGGAGVTGVGVGQRIEQLNSYDLAGSTATLSLDMSNSLLGVVTWTAYYANTADTFGTLASPTRTQIATGTFNVTSTLANFSAQITIPAAATTGIEVVFTVGAQTSGTWVIGNLQLEKGAAKTSFDYREIGEERRICQSYLPKWEAVGSNQSIGVGMCFSTSLAVVYLSSPVNLRVPPTGIFATGTFQLLNSGAAGVAASGGVTFNNGSKSGLTVGVGVGTGLVAGNATHLLGTNSFILGTGCEL
jgi:hypothetical protein